MNPSRLALLLQFYEEDPRDAFTRFAIAQEYVKQGDSERAEAFYIALVADQPDYVGTYYHLGKLYERQQFYDKAQEIYKKGIEIAEQSSALHERAELQNALMNLLYGGGDDD